VLIESDIISVLLSSRIPKQVNIKVPLKNDGNAKADLFTKYTALDILSLTMKLINNVSDSNKETCNTVICPYSKGVY